MHQFTVFSITHYLFCVKFILIIHYFLYLIFNDSIQFDLLLSYLNDYCIDYTKEMIMTILK